jgi:hypothetical protein
LQLIAANILSIDVTSRDVAKWRISRELSWFDSSTAEPTAPPNPQHNSNTPLRSTTPLRNNTPPPLDNASRRLSNKVSCFIDRYKIESSWLGVHLFADRHKKKYVIEFD